jgi:hypothetical protein
LVCISLSNNVIHCYSHRTHFPWSLDDDCNSYSIQFGHNLPTVGLVSYPSSGNTWLRYMIEGASGYFTGSMYNDITIAQKGSILILKADNTLTIAAFICPRA